MYKLGRLPTIGAPRLRFADFVKAVPKHPVSEDYLSQLTDWQVLGNDQHSDCVAVAWANSRRFTSALLGGMEYDPTQTQVYDLYKTQNPAFPAQDGGMVMQLMLDYVHTIGGPDGVKALAFASVNYNDLEEVKAALAIFGGLLLGIMVQEENMQDFDEGQPWLYHHNGTTAGGHGVLGGGYLGDLYNDIRFITWGQETGLTDTFWQNMVEEVWLVIWPENLGTKQFMEGIDVPALQKAYQQLTGDVLPIPMQSDNSGCAEVLKKLLGIH